MKDFAQTILLLSILLIGLASYIQKYILPSDEGSSQEIKIIDFNAEDGQRYRAFIHKGSLSVVPLFQLTTKETK